MQLDRRPVTDDGLQRRRERVQRSLSKTRDPGRADRYQERKLAGLCTTCGDPVVEDRQQCAPHLEAAREATRAAMERLRTAERKAGLCASGCGRKSKTYRCTICSIRSGRVPSKNVNEGVNVAAPRIEQRVERDSTAGSGVTTGVRVRNRYAGRGGGEGRRGAPSRDQIEADDVRNLRFAIREAEKAITALEFCATEPVQSLPKIQREAARREALAPADLASRLIDETLDRNKYGQEAQLRLSRRNRPR